MDNYMSTELSIISDEIKFKRLLLEAIKTIIDNPKKAFVIISNKIEISKIFEIKVKELLEFLKIGVPEIDLKECTSHSDCDISFVIDPFIDVDYDYDNTILDDDSVIIEEPIKLNFNLVCEVCGHNDLPVSVCCSGLGAMSLSYCSLCLSLGAEPKGLVLGSEKEGLYEKGKNIYYDKETDSYKTSNDTSHPITITSTNGQKSSITINTRSEAVKLYKRYEEIPRNI